MGSAVNLYHDLIASDLPGTLDPLRRHFNIGPPDSQIITFSNRSNLKSVKHEVVMDNHNINDRLFISPIQDITDITDSHIAVEPTAPVRLTRDTIPQVSGELIDIISIPNMTS